MQETTDHTLSTVIDWERELKNPQSPFFKLYVAALESAVDEQACLIQLFEYWADKTAWDESDKSYQAWLVQERENAELVMMQKAPMVASVVANEAIPEDKNELHALLDVLSERQYQLQEEVDHLTLKIKVCDRKLSELNKEWNALQSEKVDHLVAEWKKQFDAGNIRDPQGIPIPPPPPVFLDKLRDAMHDATPQKQCEVNPSLLDKDASQFVKFRNIVSLLGVINNMVEYSGKDKACSFSEAGLDFIKNNKTMLKSEQTNINKEAAIFEKIQDIMRQRQAFNEVKDIAEKNLAAINKEVEKVNEAMTEFGYNRPRSSGPQ